MTVETSCSSNASKGWLPIETPPPPSRIAAPGHLQESVGIPDVGAAAVRAWRAARRPPHMGISHRWQALQDLLLVEKDRVKAEGNLAVGADRGRTGGQAVL